jgi:hypothetical protein
MAGADVRKPTAVLVVSAWHEGEPPKVAARITYTLDVTKPSRVSVAAAGIGEIEAVVRRWLDGVAGS